MPDRDDELSRNNDEEEQVHIENLDTPYTKESIGFLGPVTAYKPEINESKKERSRFWLVLFLVCTIFVVLMIPFVLLLLNIKLEDKYWEYLHIAFPALLGVFGSAATFYFERR